MNFAVAGLTAGGKTSLLEALTGISGTAAGKGHQKGTIVVPDERVDALTKLSSSKKTTHAVIQLCDSPGLSSEQSGLNYNDRILGDLRDMDGLLIVVRAFDSMVVPHPLGVVDPVRDIERILNDLRVSDLGIVEKRLEKLEQWIPREPKAERQIHEVERDILLKVHTAIEEGADVDLGKYSEKDLATVKGYCFFVQKPIMAIINVGDLTSAAQKGLVADLENWGTSKKVPVVTINAALENELREFSDEERKDYYEEMGLAGPGLESLLKTAYTRMDLISFLTTGEKESRAWPIPRGTTALAAAGTIHSDFTKAFIRAEVVPFDDLIRLGSEAEARKVGLMRSEGKDYIVKDGDVILFHVGR